MTTYEQVSITILTLGLSAIAFLFWRIVVNQNAAIKKTQDDNTALKKEHFKTKEDHTQKLNDHNTELQKHQLELEHSKEISIRSEKEMKELMQQHNEKFDKVIELFAESINFKRKR